MGKVQAKFLNQQEISTGTGFILKALFHYQSCPED
jgi:hypothetical protein